MEKVNIFLRLRFLAILSFIINFSHAQTWQWAKSSGGLNNDAGRVICTDASGNVIVAGGYSASSINIGTLTLTNAGGGDIYLAKYDPNGNVLWAQNIGGSGLDIVGGVCTATNGNIYISGSYDSPTLTVSLYNLSQSSSIGNNDMFIACYSPNGSVQWAVKYGSTGNEKAGGVVYSDALSSLFLTGHFNGTSFSVGTTTLTNSSSSTYDMFVARFNNFGTATWAVKTGSASCNDYGLVIDKDASNNLYIGGTFSPVTGTQSFIGSTVNTYGSQDVYVAKYNSSGTFQWVRTGGSNSSSGDYLLGLTVDGLDNVYIDGYYYGSTMNIGTTALTNAGLFDGFLAKYNSAGTFQWATSIGGTGTENFNSVTTDGNNNVYVSGSFATPSLAIGSATLINSGSSDVLVVKYTSTGTPLWAAKATSTSGETGYGCAADALGNLYVTGSYNIADPVVFGTTTLAAIGNNDCFLSKIGCASAFINGPTTVCEGSSATLTATGATSYTWNTGATTTSIVVTPTSNTTYSVAGSSGACNATGNTFNISLLTASLNPGSNLNLFCSQQQVINASCSPSATSVAWTPTTNLSSSTILTPTVTASSSPITYSVTANLSNGCTLTKTISVSSYAPAPDICMVTVDSLGNNNEIYWDKALYPMLDSMIILRQTSTNVYKRIGAVSKNALSMFIDTIRSVGPANGDPNISTYRYKLQMRDSCGNYSQPGLWHNTVYFTNSNGTFFWVNNYTIEGSPLPTNPVVNYSLMVCINPTVSPNFLVVGVTAGNQNSLTDPNYSTYQATADWRVEANLGYQCQPTLKAQSPMVKATKSRSNIQNNRTIGIKKNNFSFPVNFYPNPVKGTLYINFGAPIETDLELDLQNVLGQTVMVSKIASQNASFSVLHLEKGIYLASIKQEGKAIAVKKIIIE